MLLFLCVWSTCLTILKANSPSLTSHPLRAEEGSNLTLICTTTEKYIWYINWKRNGADIFGMGPDTGLASTNEDFERLKDRVIYSISPGKQYNVTLISVDPKIDHGSSWTCRVRGEDSNTIIIRVGDLPLATTTSAKTTSATTPSTSTNIPTTTSPPPSTITTTTTATTTTTTTTTTTAETTSIDADTTQRTASTVMTELSTFDQPNSTASKTAQTPDSFTESLREETTVHTPLDKGLDLAGITAGGVAGAILLMVVGFCVYGAVRKRKKGK